MENLYLERIYVEPKSRLAHSGFQLKLSLFASISYQEQKKFFICESTKEP